jgi:hypothetical protein
MRCLFVHPSEGPKPRGSGARKAQVLDDPVTTEEIPRVSVSQGLASPSQPIVPKLATEASSIVGSQVLTPYPSSTGIVVAYQSIPKVGRRLLGFWAHGREIWVDPDVGYPCARPEPTAWARLRLRQDGARIEEATADVTEPVIGPEGSASVTALEIWSRSGEATCN